MKGENTSVSCQSLDGLSGVGVEVGKTASIRPCWRFNSFISLLQLATPHTHTHPQNVTARDSPYLLGNRWDDQVLVESWGGGVESVWGEGNGHWASYVGVGERAIWSNFPRASNALRLSVSLIERSKWFSCLVLALKCRFLCRCNHRLQPPPPLYSHLHCSTLRA